MLYGIMFIASENVFEWAAITHIYIVMLMVYTHGLWMKGSVKDSKRKVSRRIFILVIYLIFIAILAMNFVISCMLIIMRYMY